jgi:carbon-monoxide dehydrogenase large subunit
VANAVVGTRYVGAPLRAVDDLRKVAGTGQFVDDLYLPRTAYAAFLRSEHAHARIRGIDTSGAESHDGVLAVRTFEDYPHVPPLRVGSMAPSDTLISTPLLANGKVRMVGEVVAVVVAGSRYVAEDAVGLIDVEYEPLPSIPDAARAQSDNAPLIHEELRSNIVLRDGSTDGDVENALAEADVVVRETFKSGRCTHTPMECRGILADWDRGRHTLTIRASMQFAHAARNLMAKALDLPEHNVRVILPDVGGAFGQKCSIYPEDLCVSLLSMELERPVKWIESRTENLAASCHARDYEVELEAAAKNDGTITGMRAKVTNDMGAYGVYPWPFDMWARGLATSLPGPYRVPNFQWEIRCVLTNKAPGSPYRAPGVAIGSWAREAMIDLIARELSLDPVEVRLKNMAAGTGRPEESLAPSAPTERTLREAIQASGYHEYRNNSVHSDTSGKRVGIGVGCYSWGQRRSARRSSMAWKAPAADGGFSLASELSASQEAATVRMLPNGRVEAFVSVSPHGQKLETTLAQILADELGVRIETIKVIHGDSNLPAEGAGTWGDRSAKLGGGAIILSGRDMKRKILGLAAHLLEAPAEELEIEDGNVVSRTDPDEKLPVAEIASLAHRDPERFPDGLEGGLISTKRYQDPGWVGGSTGSHVAVVEVDIETGEVSILKYVAVEDCGRVINPMVVEGQIHGCIAQALGEVLLEELVYDETAQLVTGTLMDYAIPRADQMPDIEVRLLGEPSEETLGGFKSAGEGAFCAAVPAISNAISDALAPAGPSISLLPVTPERVVRAAGRL